MNPALPSVLIVTPAVYPRLVVNYKFSYLKVNPLNLESLNHSKNIPVFPNKRLRSIGQGVPEL